MPTLTWYIPKVRASYIALSLPVPVTYPTLEQRVSLCPSFMSTSSTARCVITNQCTNGPLSEGSCPVQHWCENPLLQLHDKNSRANWRSEFRTRVYDTAQSHGLYKTMVRPPTLEQTRETWRFLVNTVTTAVLSAVLTALAVLTVLAILTARAVLTILTSAVFPSLTSCVTRLGAVVCFAALLLTPILAPV